MIILDKPYVSKFLQETIRDFKIPVLKTEILQEIDLIENLVYIDKESALKKLKNDNYSPLYTNSENSINWIKNNLAFTGLPERINIFKDKVKFRELLKTIYPYFYYREINLEEIDDVKYADLPQPFVFKPSVGFFSIGVSSVPDEETWNSTKELIKTQINTIKNLYPEEVIDVSKFIIEEYVEGTEYAFDAYYDSEGHPVILNILQHIFSSNEDVSDRVYVTSKDIIENNLDLFNNFLETVGNLSGLKNFPLHVEVRLSDDDKLVPIEINPMRFGGWCTTADMTYYALNFNSYEYFFSQKKPDWNELLKDKGGKLFSIIVLDNSTGYDGRMIENFDYDKLLASFENPLELRKINYEEYPVFGFLFTETSQDNLTELQRILTSDLREFITLKENNRL